MLVYDQSSHTLRVNSKICKRLVLFIYDLCQFLQRREVALVKIPSLAPQCRFILHRKRRQLRPIQQIPALSDDLGHLTAFYRILTQLGILVYRCHSLEFVFCLRLHLNRAPKPLLCPLAAVLPENQLWRRAGILVHQIGVIVKLPRKTFQHGFVQAVYRLSIQHTNRVAVREDNVQALWLCRMPSDIRDGGVAAPDNAQVR